MSISSSSEGNHPQICSSEDLYFVLDAVFDVYSGIVQLEDTLDQRFIIHRSACHSLIKSYRIGFKWIEQLIKLALSNSPSQSFLNLHPCLHELLHHMLLARMFLGNCIYHAGDGWLQKAVLLAFNTDAWDQHLEGLEWCMFVINRTIKQALIKAKAPGHVIAYCNNYSHVVESVRKAWGDMHADSDRAVLWIALDKDLKAPTFLTDDCRDTVARTEQSDNLEQKILIEFLKRALSRVGAGTSEPSHHNGSLLPRHLLVDHLNITVQEEVLKKSNNMSSMQRVVWCGGQYAQKMFKGVHNASAFGLEVAILAKCRHPNVVQLIGYTENPVCGNYSMLLELEEMNLKQYLAKFKSGAAPLLSAEGDDGAVHLECTHRKAIDLSLFAKVDIMLQICKGMESIRSQGIHHRDLKTDNILVTELPHSYFDSSSKVTQVLSNKPNKQPRVRVKVAVYEGFREKKLQTDFELEALSNSDTQVGTTNFRAPEGYMEYKCSSAFAEKSDVYSFGMVCYEILTGEEPFLGARLDGLRNRLLSGERSQSPSYCLGSLVDLIKQCQHENPEERPTFATISRDLRHHMAVQLSSFDLISTCSGGLLANKYSNWIECQLHNQLGTKWPLSEHTLLTCTPTSSISLLVSRYQTVIQKARCGHIRPSRAKIYTKLFASVRSFCLSLFYGAAKDTCKLFAKDTYQYPNGSGSLEALKCFTYEELDAATHHFDRADQIGKGSSGFVFKGKLGDGRLVAVKVMEGSSKKRYRDGFFTELASLGNLRHCNLVSLLGWCWEKGNLILVYEYVSRGDLHHLLFGQVQKLFLSWEQRYKIVCGVASALHYLHFQCARPIIHRDVKPNNILLDNDYNARLGDFGLAIDLEHPGAQVTTCARGTVGYIAPEYVLAHKLGPEADVYSFGVVVLELVCGKRLFKMSPGEVTNVVPFVWNLYTQNQLLDAGDKRLNFKSDIKKEDMERLLLLGLACTQCNIEDRPNMALVLRILSKEVQPPTPAHAPYGTL